MRRLTCLECDSNDIEVVDWYKHGCFIAKPRNVWLTPTIKARDEQLAGTKTRFELPRSCMVIERLWSPGERSFKALPIATAASIGEELGFRTFATASCGGGGTELLTWSRPRGYRCIVYMPESIQTPTELHNATTVPVNGGWATTHQRFWEFLSTNGTTYPVFPSGDPWYLASLRERARSVLKCGAEAVILPCGSGVHLLSFLEEAVALETKTHIIAVQILGNDPLVAEWLNKQQPVVSASCSIRSMSSQSPVNLRRIIDTARICKVCTFVSVSAEDVDWAENAHSPTIRDFGWVPDRSIYACLAGARKLSLVNAHVISTAGEQAAPKE